MNKKQKAEYDYARRAAEMIRRAMDDGLNVECEDGTVTDVIITDTRVTLEAEREFYTELFDLEQYAYHYNQATYDVETNKDYLKNTIVITRPNPPIPVDWEALTYDEWSNNATADH